MPLTAFLTDLKSALAALPWKKVAIGVGVVFGAVVALLALVLTAAELTDDLKPRRSASATSGADISTRHVVEASTPATRPTSMVVSEPATTPSAPANAPTVETASIEIEEDVTEPPAAAAKPVAPKSAAPKPNASAVGSAKKPLLPKKKGVEIFIP